MLRISTLSILIILILPSYIGIKTIPETYAERQERKDQCWQCIGMEPVTGHME